MITVLDSRTCVLQCTLPRCAIVVANEAPIAEVGDDLAVYAGDTVSLDGTGSVRPGGQRPYLPLVDP